MRILNPNNLKKYMTEVMEFHNATVNQQTMLIYEGNVNDDVTIAFTKLVEKNMKELLDNKRTSKRVYYVIIELLQNIKRHADNPDIDKDDTVHTNGGIFMLGSNENDYYVTTGNLVKTKKVNKIQKMLSEFNKLDTDQIKQKYRELLHNNEISEKGGAGLGFIDVIKKTRNCIKYSISDQKNDYSFFMQQSKISRI